MDIVARVYTDYKEKFGIPRQSGLTRARGLIVFEPEFRDPNYIRGIEEFNYLWIIWQFSENVREKHNPTVRPPKLGGEERWGVFATRSPFRPNNMGLSSVRLVEVVDYDGSKALCVEGVDMLDGTPIYDIKPYIPYSDIHEDAQSGFTVKTLGKGELEVIFPEELLARIPLEKQEVLIKTLELDPRPAFMEKMDREYGLRFDEFDITFTIENNKLFVTGV